MMTCSPSYFVLFVFAAIKAMSDDDQSQVQSQMRAMYTACSRARDVLYVLSDLTPGSPMEEILQK